MTGRNEHAAMRPRVRAHLSVVRPDPIATHYGFEPAGGHGSVHLPAENMFIMLLVLAANPAALRGPFCGATTHSFISRAWLYSGVML
jgi:hypothetical protein